MKNKWFIFVIIYFIITGFGQNKIQYKNFKWKILKTPHFDIFYSQGGRKLAEQAAFLLEDANEKLSENLKFELTRIIPVILYNSHNDFEQSNVILQLIGEGTGGFTEVLKSRVVVPFTGSYAEFRHVLHHELTHAYQYNILLGGFWESLFSRPFMYMPPLWFMEGMAEQQSRGIDTEVDMILRDITVHNMIIPIPEFEKNILSGLETFLLYQESNGFLTYLAERYGKNRIGEVLRVFKRSRDMHYSFKSVFGKSYAELSDEWIRHLRRKYWPLVKDKKEPDEIGYALTHHLQDGSFYNTKPCWSPDGKYIAFMTDRNIFINIVLIDADTGEEVDTIVESGRKSSFEEMHVQDNSLSWSSDGRYLVFVSKSGPYDKINIYDFTNQTVRQINPHLDAVGSPAISPDGKYIAFKGIKNGKCDIYLMDFDGKNLKKLTDDLFYDTMPVWTKDGKYLIFVSNRDRGYLAPGTDIFLYSFKTKKIIKIISSKGKNFSPDISPDNKKIVFVSDRDGIFNLYIKVIKDFDAGEGILYEPEYRITDIIGGAFDPKFSPDGKKILFSAYNKVGQDLYVMRLPEKFAVESKQVVSTPTNKIEKLNPNFSMKETIKREYKFTVTPDMIMGGLAFSSVAGFGGFLKIIASDILGNHRFFFATDFATQNNDYNFIFTYYYLPLRFDLGVSIFHLKEYYFSYYRAEYEYYFEYFFLRRYGINLLLSYPFTKFFRFDFEILGMKYLKIYENSPELNEDANIFLTSMGLIYDSVLWGIISPIWGTRWQLYFQKCWKLSSNYWMFERFYFDFRKYFLLGKTHIFAVRVEGGSIWGPQADKNKFYIGGFTTVRGHPLFGYSGKRMALINLEYRFLFIKEIKIAWPFSFSIGNLRSLFFWDIGSVWNYTKKWRFGYTDGRFKFDDVISGLGIGFRFILFPFIIRLDFSTPFDGSKIYPLNKWQGFISFGYDF